MMTAERRGEGGRRRESQSAMSINTLSPSDTSIKRNTVRLTMSMASYNVVIGYSVVGRILFL